MLQQNNENREICKLSKESHKYVSFQNWRID